ncbi:MAG: 30S ribosomal protein S4 [Candidatus Paceibacterota bacterium]
MVKIKQFKIARRLGAPIFPKCDNPHFSTTPKIHGKGGRRFSARSEYSKQLLEKQKARYSYGLSEKQFSNYVKEAMEKKGIKPIIELYTLLETRLDNSIYRLGIAKTRRFARQLVSHGHITINGRRVTIPSRQLIQGDMIGIKKASLEKPLFEGLTENLKEKTPPAWLSFSSKTKEGKVEGTPVLSEQDEASLDLPSVIEFYSR